MKKHNRTRKPITAIAWFNSLSTAGRLSVSLSTAGRVTVELPRLTEELDRRLAIVKRLEAEAKGGAR